MKSESKECVYVRLDAGLKNRVLQQCERLCISQNAIAKMALVKFLEEAEKEVRNLSKD